MEKKGITIEIGADTSKFDKAIKSLNKDVSKINTELRKVDKALKFNPSSVDLWRQKQQLLTEKISDTEKKLDQLKQKQATMDAAGVDKSSEEYRKLQREIIETESKLKQLKGELTKLGSVKLKALGEQFKKIGAEMEKVGKTLTTKVSAPILAVYGAAAKASLSYGDAIAKVATIADESEVPIETLQKSILDLSNNTGKSATELAEAAYQALSASVDTKDVAGFLEDASGLAKAGFLETADAVDVLTTIINAYGYKAEDATKIANELIQTQNDGKTTVNELAQAMGTVIPTASALNIPLEQLTTSYVMMTKQGINTANATTYLNGMFTELADGGSDVSAILQEKTGKTFGQLMKEGASLGDVLKILNESVDGDSEAFLNLWGNTRAGRGALSLLNAGVDEFNNEVGVMSSGVDNMGDALKKLKTPGAEARKALNMLVNAGIEIGDVLAPYIEKAAKALQTLAKKFNALSPKMKKTLVIIGGIVAAIGPALVLGGKIFKIIGVLMIAISKIIGVIKLLGAAVGIVSSTALLPIIAVIGLVIAAFVLWKKRGEEIKAFFINFGKALVLAFTNMKNNVVAIWNSMKTAVTNAVNSLKTNITNAWNNAKTAVINVVNNIKSSVTSAFTSLKSKVSSAWNSIKSAIVTPIQSAWDKVSSLVSKIKSIFPIKLGKIFSGIKLPHFKISGGKIPWGINGMGTPPSVKIEWYKKGGIFKNPTVFSGVGIGEAGAEAVVPLDILWKKLDNIAAASSGSPIINVYARDGQSAREIAQEAVQILISDTNRRKMAWQ